jgi:hypothetical protein
MILYPIGNKNTLLKKQNQEYWEKQFLLINEFNRRNNTKIINQKYPYTMSDIIVVNNTKIRSNIDELVRNDFSFNMYKK